MDELLKLRNEIDEIDDELISLLMKRMEISKAVAEYKIKQGMPVLNVERENEILNAVAEKCGDKGDLIKTVFSAVLDASKTLQYGIIDGEKEE